MHSLHGQFLVAAPELLDPNFHQTVVLIVQHNEEGALGLVLNRPTGTLLAQAWAQVSDAPCHSDGLLHVGGPCQGPLMVVHRHADAAEVEVLPESTSQSAALQAPATPSVAPATASQAGAAAPLAPGPGVYFAAESDKVEWLVQHNQFAIKFFVGYSGWAAGQLDQEMQSGSWLTLPASAELIFDTPPDVWKKLIDHLRPAVNPRIVPPDPSWN